MSIKARLLITISVLIAVAFAAIGVVTVRLTEARMVERVDDTLATATTKPARSGYGPGEHHRDDYGKRATATMFYGPRGNVVYSEPSGFTDEPDPLPDIQFSDLAAREADGHAFTVAAADGSD